MSSFCAEALCDVFVELFNDVFDFEPNTDEPAPANLKLGSALKASGRAAAAASVENDIPLLEKRLLSSLF